MSERGGVSISARLDVSVRGWWTRVIWSSQPYLRVDSAKSRERFARCCCLWHFCGRRHGAEGEVVAKYGSYILESLDNVEIVSTIGQTSLPGGQSA